jgi:hypothetical protein
MCGAFTYRFTSAADIVNCTEQIFERLFEVLRQVQPLPCVDIDADKDCRSIFRNVSAPVLSNDTASPNDQFEVIGKAEGQSVWLRLSVRRWSVFHSGQYVASRDTGEISGLVMMQSLANFVRFSVFIVRLRLIQSVCIWLQGIAAN